MPREYFPRVSLHEREVQRPPGKSQKGNPDELTLQKEPYKRNLAIENRLENGNVYPALVIRQYKIVAGVAQARRQLRHDTRVCQSADHLRVHADPTLGDADQRPSACGLCGGETK